MSIATQDISAVILAGGRSTRMGGKNKGLLPFRGRPMIQHVIDRIRPQVDTILISANQDLDAYKGFGYSVVTDQTADYSGPLAGMLAALSVMQTEWLVSVPCDVPFIGADFVARLANDDKALLRVAHDGERQQSACCLMHRDIRDALEQYLQSGQHALYRFHAEQQALAVDFSNQADMFININTPSELNEREAD